MVYLTVTTLDASLARALEPRAAAPARRLAASVRWRRRACPWWSVSPQIPFVNEDMEQVLQAAAEARSGRSTRCCGCRELKTVFHDWLAAHVPERAERVMARVQDLHGGRDYEAHFGTMHARARHLGRPAAPALHPGLQAPGPDRSAPAAADRPLPARGTERAAQPVLMPADGFDACS